VIDLLREEIGTSLQDIELKIFMELRKVFGEALKRVLEHLDDMILSLRESRFKVREMVETNLETLLGVAVRFKRRHYKDSVTGRCVYLLDEVLGIGKGSQVSPALTDLMLHLATVMSYRDAEDSLKQFYGHRPVSHETIRQAIIKIGKSLEDINEDAIANPKGKRKVDIVFIEADGLYVSLQREKKRNTEEFNAVIYEGWEPRTPGSKDFKLVNPRLYRTHEGQEFWEKASRYVYSIYDIDDNTMVVINGDRAKWIRQGINYFPNAIYQVDRFHLKRDLRSIFGKNSKAIAKLFAALDSDDTTGATFLGELAKAKSGLRGEKAKECQKLLKDLATIAESTVDYRKRLEALNRPTKGLRGLGAAEGNMARYAKRVKGKRSWRPKGLAAMMEILSWKYSEREIVSTTRVNEMLEHVQFTPKAIKRAATKAINKVVGVNNTWNATVPIKNSGRIYSGGMSNFINNLNKGGIPI